jgi:hypothetical protein
LEGIRVLAPCKDAIKREIVEKQNKSRLFTVMSMELTFLIRKYTGAFQAIVKKNRDIAHCQVGINVLPGFDQLYNRFLKVSKYGEAGDFSRWDKHLLAVLMSVGLDIILDLYLENVPKQDQTIFTNVFKVIKDNIINSISVCDGVVYMKIIGNPSGQGLTTVLNGLVNDLQVIMGVLWCTRNHNKFLETKPTDQQLFDKYGKEFHNLLRFMREPIKVDLHWIQKHVDWVNYGDDLVRAISASYLWLLNFETAKTFYWEILGITYDTPEKDGGMYKYSQITELSFISRIFRREAGLIFPALKKSSIESLLHWARKNSKQQWKDNFKVCLDEASLWGEEYYNHISNIILKITDFCHKYRISVEVTIPTYKNQLANNISKIRDGKIVEILPKEPQLKVQFNVEKSIDTKINELFNKMLRESEQQGEDPEFLILTKNIDNALRHVDFFGNELLRYKPFPAVLKRKTGATVVSICFDGITFAIDKKSVVVQSDIDKYVLPVIKEYGLTLQDWSVCYRSIDGGKSLTPVWQVTFNYKIKAINAKPSTRLPLTQQATGTQQRNPIQGGDTQAPDGEEVIKANGRDIVPKRDIQRVLWHRDICEVAHTPMETIDSPISIKIDTPAHTVIFKRELNNTKNMPPGMKLWANMHKYTNATRVISVKFISAATLINEIVCGISPVSKTTYTVQELQLIKWVALNPQDVTATIRLELSDVAWNGFSNGEVNRYEFNENSGTDASPINIPTFVMLTRVGIQNSYANSDLSIQLAVTEHFERGGKFLIDQDILNSGIPKTIYGYRQSNGETLAEWLNLPPGKPLYITCDGQFLGKYPSTTYTNMTGTVFTKSAGVSVYYDSKKVPKWSTLEEPDVICMPFWHKDNGHFTDTFEQLKTVYQVGLRSDTTNPMAMTNIPRFYFLFPLQTNNQVTLKDIPVKIHQKPDNDLQGFQWVIDDAFSDADEVVIKVLPSGLTFTNRTYLWDGYYNSGTTDDSAVFTPSTVKNSASGITVSYYVEITKNGLHHKYLGGSTYLYYSTENEIMARMHGALSEGILFDFTFNGSIPDSLPSVLIKVNREDSYTLDTNYSLLSFPSTVPTTLPTAVAETRVPTEWNDYEFVTAFKRKLHSAGITYNNTTELVLFNISTQLNGNIAMVVAYNPQYDAFFIANSPKNDLDCYKVFRKLQYEDVIFSQPRVIDKMSGAIPITNTSGWLSRISESKTYDGVNLISRQILKIKEKKVALRPTQQAAAAGIIAGGGIIASLFQEIGGYFIQQSLMDQQLQNNLKEIQAKYQNQMNLIDEQNKNTIQQLEKKYELELRNAKDLSAQNFQQKLQTSGLTSAMPWTTNGSRPQWMSDKEAGKPMYSNFAPGNTESTALIGGDRDGTTFDSTGGKNLSPGPSEKNGDVTPVQSTSGTPTITTNLKSQPIFDTHDLKDEAGDLSFGDFEGPIKTIRQGRNTLPNYKEGPFTLTRTQRNYDMANLMTDEPEQDFSYTNFGDHIDPIAIAKNDYVDMPKWVKTRIL